MTIITLDDLDQTVATALREKIKAALQSDSVAAVSLGGTLVATLMGPQAVRDAIHHRVLRKLANEPEAIEVLRKRFESTDLVP